MTATKLVVDATSSTPVSSDPTPIQKLAPAKLLVIVRPVKVVFGFIRWYSKILFSSCVTSIFFVAACFDHSISIKITRDSA